MARPKKQDHEKRSAQLPPVRVTEAEMVHVVSQAKAAGLSLSDYSRQRVLSGRLPPAPSRQHATLITELNRIGVNVNQIARQINRGRDHDPHHLDAVMHELHTALQRITR